MHEAIYSLIMLNNDFLAESANINELVEEAEGMNILTKRHVRLVLALHTPKRMMLVAQQRRLHIHSHP